jgi:hypothetical protein
LVKDEITSMVMAGTHHFKAILEESYNQDMAETIYEACRLHNSGSINESDLSDSQGAVSSYVGDIYNRLQGCTPMTDIVDARALSCSGTTFSTNSRRTA